MVYNHLGQVSNLSLQFQHNAPMKKNYLLAIILGTTSGFLSAWLSIIEQEGRREDILAFSPGFMFAFAVLALSIFCRHQWPKWWRIILVLAIVSPAFWVSVWASLGSTDWFITQMGAQGVVILAGAIGAAIVSISFLLLNAHITAISWIKLVCWGALLGNFAMPFAKSIGYQESPSFVETFIMHGVWQAGMAFAFVYLLEKTNSN